MPTYSYKCDKCEHEFDIMQRMSDKRLTHCPSCNKESLQKVIKSTNGFALKGKGWFKSGGY